MMGTDVLRGANRVAMGLGLLVAGVAFAGPLGTPFEELATEVDARRNAIDRPVDRTERREKRTLNKVRRELRKVDRGLKRDLRSAVRVARKLEKVFPDDAVLDPLLDGMLDGYATLLSNRVFAAEDSLDQAADPQRGYAAGVLLQDAREIETFAAAAEGRSDHVARARHLRRLANRLIAAEKAIAFEPPPAPAPDPEPEGAPVDGTSGFVEFTVNGVRAATQTVAGASSLDSPSGEFDIHVDAQTSSAQLSGLTFDWKVSVNRPIPTYAIGSGDGEARAVLRVGNAVYDQNTSGEIRIRQMKAQGGTLQRMKLHASFRVTAQDAAGRQISVIGLITIDDMPFSGF